MRFHHDTSLLTATYAVLIIADVRMSSPWKKVEAVLTRYRPKARFIALKAPRSTSTFYYLL